jgi:hypothetical protein
MSYFIETVMIVQCCSSDITSTRFYDNILMQLVEVGVKLRPTVSRPVCLGVVLPSVTHDQIFFLTIVGFLMWGALSDERMSL